MKSQIYTVPPTPVQEYQEALFNFSLDDISIHYNYSVGALDSTLRQVSLWMSGTLRQLPLKTFLRSSPGHSGRYLSGCSPGNSHSWSSSSPGHSDRCLSIPISLLTEEDCERTGSELEWFSNPSRLGERECPGRPMKVRGGGCGGGWVVAANMAVALGEAEGDVLDS